METTVAINAASAAGDSAAAAAVASVALWGPLSLLAAYGGARAGTALLGELRNVIFSKVIIRRKKRLRLPYDGLMNIGINNKKNLVRSR